MPSRRAPVLLAGFILCSCARRAEPPPNAPAASTARPAPDPAHADLGTLTFEVTGGTEEARRAFVRGLLAYHSFWYEEAAPQFRAAVAADRSFVMGHWGLAMSHSQLLFQQDDVAAGRAALAAMPPLEGVSERERAWVE